MLLITMFFPSEFPLQNAQLAAVHVSGQDYSSIRLRFCSHHFCFGVRKFLFYDSYARFAISTF